MECKTTSNCIDLAGVHRRAFLQRPRSCRPGAWEQGRELLEGDSVRVRWRARPGSCSFQLDEATCRPQGTTTPPGRSAAVNLVDDPPDLAVLPGGPRIPVYVPACRGRHTMQTTSSRRSKRRTRRPAPAASARLGRPRACCRPGWAGPGAPAHRPKAAASPPASCQACREGARVQRRPSPARQDQGASSPRRSTGCRPLPTHRHAGREQAGGSCRPAARRRRARSPPGKPGRPTVAQIVEDQLAGGDVADRLGVGRPAAASWGPGSRNDPQPEARIHRREPRRNPAPPDSRWR